MTSQAGGVNFQNQSGVYHKACTYLLCNILGGISILAQGSTMRGIVIGLEQTNFTAVRFVSLLRKTLWKKDWGSR